MKIQPALIWFSALLMLSPLAVHAENSPAAETKSDSCALFKPDDLTALLGGTPVAKANPASCSWAVAGSKSKLIAVKYANTGMSAEMAYMSARKNAAKGGTVNDEKDLGDRAFARMESFGVSLVIIKQGRLLQLQYGAGVPGTAKDLDALLPVAKKAASAL